MSQIENMIILYERAVILLTRPEVSALRIKTLANNKILNIAPRATVSDKNVICKQSEKRGTKEKITPKLFLAHQSIKKLWKFRYLNRYCYLKSQKGEIVGRKI